MGYSYDPAGNVTTLTYPDGKTVTYTYDSLNRLETVSIDWLGRSMRYHYDDANRLDFIEHFNDMETDYSWDGADRLTGITHESGSTVLADYAFVLDANGNRIQETISPEPIRIKPGALINDSTGLTYNTQRNRLLSTSDHTYTYDDEGQLTGKDAITYDFDPLHRLIQRGSDTFVYDGVGNRLKAIRNGVETQYVYDAAGNLLAEANGSGQITRYYIYGAGLAALVTNGETFVYHFDGTGHTVALTSESNQTVNRYAYSPYGEVLGEQEQIGQPFKYAGQVGIYTEDDNLYYMRARYYDAETGRFISEDPAGFDGGLNLYAYVGGNPINAIDPHGDIPLPVVTGIIGGVSGLVGACFNGCSFKEAAIGLGTGAVAGAVGGTARIVQFVGGSFLRSAGVGSGLATASNASAQVIDIGTADDKSLKDDFSFGQVGLSAIGGGLGGAKTAKFGQTVVERVAAGFVSTANQLPFALPFGASGNSASGGNTSSGK